MKSERMLIESLVSIEGYKPKVALPVRLRITESELGGRKTKARANQGLRPQDKLGYRLFDQDTIH